MAADNDQQSEPDMFSMLYEKIETARQIPFIAISPFVFVNVGSSYVQWLITPANFSLAVPGASSGGGSSFDPASDQTISGNWKFTQPLKIPEARVATEAVTQGYVNARFQQTVDIISVQTINGTKTFSASPVVPTPTAKKQAANKNYVDVNITQVKSQLETTMRYTEMTEAEYNALSEKANNCIYYLTDKSMWDIGDKKIVTSDMPASMYLYNTTIQSAELATGSAVAVTLPEDAPEGMYEIRFISATPTGTGLSVQPSEFRVKVTSSNPPGTQRANTAAALGKSNLIIYEDENGSLKKVVPSMGMLYKIPANCTVVSAQQYMYHVQGGSDKVSFSMPSIAAEVTPNSVNITFIQIA